MGFYNFVLFYKISFNKIAIPEALLYFGDCCLKF